MDQYLTSNTCNLSGSISFVISSRLISAMVLGPFLSGLEAKPWVDNNSSKSSSFTFGLGPVVKIKPRDWTFDSEIVENVPWQQALLIGMIEQGPQTNSTFINLPKPGPRIPLSSLPPMTEEKFRL